jgi:hypothetical protein
MPNKPIELAPAVARRFVEDMRAFHAEPNASRPTRSPHASYMR